MEKKQPKTPYFLFGVAVLYNTFAMVVAITVYLYMKENTTTGTIRPFMFLLPIIATILIFFDLRFKFREIKSYRQTNQE